MKPSERLYRFLGSKEVAVSLFLLLCIALIPGTLAKTKYYQLSWYGAAILGLIVLNAVLCTLQRIRTLSRPVLIIHLGAVLICLGGIASSFGYVATVNIYEGSSTGTAYRWDKEQDMPLGFNLGLKKIHLDYYPSPVKVGILKGGEKAGLFELKTGESFNIGQYTVRPDYLELPSKNLRLSVFEGGHAVGFADTEGMRNLPPDFPYDFKLVAFQNPSPKMVGVDLVISEKTIILAEGRSEVNSPLTWNKMRFYNTAMDTDEFGQSFAGIQITKDPGRPYVYAGFMVLGLGSLLYFLKRVVKVRQ